MTNQHTPQAEEAQLDENQIIALRREKLNKIRQHGIAFPNDFSRNAFAGDLQAQYGALEKAELDPQEIPVKVAGRMMLKRAMGKASFATLQDASGRTDWPKGYSCIAEKRCIETLQNGQPSTEFMRYGDTIRIEMKGKDGHTIFGAIDQAIAPPSDSSV